MAKIVKANPRTQPDTLQERTRGASVPSDERRSGRVMPSDWRTPFLNSRYEGVERVIGTYLYPNRTFGVAPPTDRYSLLEVIETVLVDSQMVLITRNGGLFVRPPFEIAGLGLPDPEEMETAFWKKIDFERQAAYLFN